MRKVDAEMMKNLDYRAQQEFGIPGLILMENAGLRAAETAVKLLKKGEKKEIVIFCGPGNNGGDGFVLARHLLNRKFKVKIFLLTGKNKINGDALVNFNILLKMHTSVIEILNLEEVNKIKPVLKKTPLVIDAIFGIGLNKTIDGVFEKVIGLINLYPGTILSLDTPSGLCATTGKVLGVCVCAHITVTFGIAKKGFFKNQGPKYVGQLIVADISLPLRLTCAYRAVSVSEPLVHPISHERGG